MIYAHFVMIEEWWNTQFVILNTQSVIVEWWKSSPVNEFQQAKHLNLLNKLTKLQAEEWSYFFWFLSFNPKPSNCIVRSEPVENMLFFEKKPWETYKRNPDFQTMCFSLSKNVVVRFNFFSGGRDFFRCW